MGRVILIRHTEVADHWKGRCYGQSDVGLSTAGRLKARAIAAHLALDGRAFVITSPLRRARFLAALIARNCGTRSVADPRLAECHFGAWEGRSWDDIYADTGNAMMGLMTAPASFRPGGGETTFELRDRAMAWFESLNQREAAIIAVAHGGPIAAIRGTLAGAPVQDWPSLVPGYGERIEFVV